MIITNHDMVRDDWMTKVYKWMGVPEKVINVIIKLMEGWKARWFLARRQLFSGRILSNGRIFFNLVEETDGYTMG